jgi:stage V sporulation protein G
MEITKINIRPIRPNEGLVAFATIELDHCLELTGIGVYTNLRAGGYRITYPTKKLNDSDIYFFRPVSDSMSKKIAEAIEKECEKIFG